MAKNEHNKSLCWIFTPLRYVKTSEFKRYKGKYTDMYCREWKCFCPRNTEKEFLDYLKVTGIKDTQSIIDCLGYQILRREINNEIEITFMTFWINLDVIKEYAGENLYKAVLYPEDYKFKIIPEVNVKIYEIIKNNMMTYN